MKWAPHRQPPFDFFWQLEVLCELARNKCNLDGLIVQIKDLGNGQEKRVRENPKGGV